MWLAQVGSERLDEIADPEKAILRGADFYRAKGYTEGWINQRLQTIEMRKKLTDEWKERGGKFAGDTRKWFEEEIGGKTISPLNASDRPAFDVKDGKIDK